MKNTHELDQEKIAKALGAESFSKIKPGEEIKEYLKMKAENRRESTKKIVENAKKLAEEMKNNSST